LIDEKIKVVMANRSDVTGAAITPMKFIVKHPSIVEFRNKLLYTA
jgi:hypothetical protein